MYQLGLMYYKGLGVPKDKEIARSWMKKSSDGGYKLAKQWKLYLAAEMLGGSSWGVDLNAGIEVRF